jgi:hypothetical protein
LLGEVPKYDLYYYLIRLREAEIEEDIEKSEESKENNMNM